MQEPPNLPEFSAPEDDEIAQALQGIEQELAKLKARYSQIQRDQALQGQLQQRRDQLRQQSPKTAQIKAELQQLQSQLETVELNLESRLITWKTFQDPIWQAVRYAGIGIVIGWFLRSHS